MLILPKANEFIKGVCHPRQNLDMMLEAGLRWVRIDAPFPYEQDRWGEISKQYLEFRSRCEQYCKQGIRIMCVTPYPRSFAAAGVDPASADGLERVRQLCGFLAADFKHLELCWQITNEMNVFHFRHPLSLEQAAAFILAGLRGVRDGAPLAVCGYNTAGIGGASLGIAVKVAEALGGAGIGDINAITGANDADKLIEALKPYHDLADYIGLDTYKGTWQDGEPEDIIADVDRAHELAGLPVILQEFGFASAGEIFTFEEVVGFFSNIGYDRLDAVFADPSLFLARVSGRLAEIIGKSPPQERTKNALSLLPHIMKKWPGGSRKYPHTPEGQAAFYDNLLGKLLAHPHLCGALIYSWSDSKQCYLCRADDCPCETAWGITYSDESPKPAYHIIRKHFAPNVKN